MPLLTRFPFFFLFLGSRKHDGRNVKAETEGERVKRREREKVRFSQLLVNLTDFGVTYFIVLGGFLLFSLSCLQFSFTPVTGQRRDLLSGDNPSAMFNWRFRARTSNFFPPININKK